ncbi:MAG: sulfite exporter TauE/SafE family protein [Halocynthiibacter sp.]
MTALLEVMATGLGLLMLAGALAGIVRGFAGFGTALVFLPIAGVILPPIEAVWVLTTLEVIGPMFILRRIWPDVAFDDVKPLLIAALLALPFGVYVLTLIGPEVFRTIVAVVSLLLLAALIFGLRLPAQISKRMAGATGAVSGFLAGVAGVPGPPVMLMFAATHAPAKRIRANMMIYLIVIDVALMSVLTLRGHFHWESLLVGLCVLGPYIGGLRLGSWIFRPEFKRAYTYVAYGIIALSACVGLCQSWVSYG